MRLQFGQYLHVRPGQYVQMPRSAGQEEERIGLIPAQFVDLKLERLLGEDLGRSCVDQCDQIVLIAGGDGSAVRRPADIDVLAFRLHDAAGLACATVPHAHGSIERGRAQLHWMAGMPAELIDGSLMPAQRLLAIQLLFRQMKDGHHLVEATCARSVFVQ